MSDALEALEKLRENVRHPAGIEFGGLRDNEETRSAIVALMDFVSAALEQGEAVVWQYTGEDGEECYTTIKAKALQFDANPTPLYTVPPSTAEAQARALIEFAIGLKQQAQQTHSMFSEGLLHAARYASAEAMRIREEG